MGVTSSQELMQTKTDGLLDLAARRAEEPKGYCLMLDGQLFCLPVPDQKQGLYIALDEDKLLVVTD